MFYFPDSLKQENAYIKARLDTFMLNWFSSALYSAREPILYNYYLGHDIYRFLWLRSFHRPAVFSLHKNKNEVWLTTKILNKQPEFMDMTYVHFSPPISDDESVIYEEITDSVVIGDRKAEIVLNQTKQLSVKEWKEFESLLDSCSFWNMKPHEESMGLDGSEWTFEGHLKNKYWFVNRWSPEDNFRKAGLFLIDKSELEEKIY